VRTIARQRGSVLAGPPGLALMKTSLAISMLGTGMWTSARVIYLARLGLSAAEIGAGLLIAGIVGALLTIPAGNLVDRYVTAHNRRDATMALLVFEGVLAALFALVHGFLAFLLVACLASAAERACAAAAATLIGEMFGPAKVECRAAMQAAMNAGLCVGGLLAAVALATGSLSALRVIAVANGLSYVIACGLTSRLRPVGIRASGPDGPPTACGEKVPPRYVRFGCANALLTIHAALLSVALPLWVARTHLVPAWSVGGAIFLNSALVGLCQLSVTRRIQGSERAGRAALGSGIMLAICCALVVTVELVPAPARLLVLTLAVGVYTMAELAHSACAIYLSYVLAEGYRLSSCQSYFASTVGAAKAIGPIVATAAVAAGPAGLLTLGLGLLLASVAVTTCGPRVGDGSWCSALVPRPWSRAPLMRPRTG